MNPIKDASDIMTVQEVAEFLKLSKITVYKLVKKGAIPGFRVGNSWRFRREDIVEIVSQQMAGAGEHTLLK
jgi:excisionase family DNA binding protein